MAGALDKTYRRLALMILHTSLTLLFGARASARAYRLTARTYSSEAYWRALLRPGPVQKRMR